MIRSSHASHLFSIHLRYKRYTLDKILKARSLSFVIRLRLQKFFCLVLFHPLSF
nr:MAG TPA: hypothetical protein [Caudoviricetes sp.]